MATSLQTYPSKAVEAVVVQGQGPLPPAWVALQYLAQRVVEVAALKTLQTPGLAVGKADHRAMYPAVLVV